MKRLVLLFICLFFISTFWADTIYENIQATAKRLTAELSEDTRSIPYVHQNYFPLTYAMTMNTRVFGPTSGLIEAWDGSQWQDLMYWDFYYDEDGLVTGYDQYYYGPGYTAAYLYHDITYDAQDRVTELWMDLDMGSGTVTGSHEIYEYGADWLDHFFLEGDYGAGNYHNQEQADFTYTNGELTEGYYQSWDEDTSQWEDDHKHTFTYDGGLLDTVLYEYYDELQWNNENFLIFTMINNVRPQEYISQIWNGSAFDNVEKYTYSYSRYEHDERLGEIWEAGNWMNEELEQVTYDNDARPIQIDRFAWDGAEWTDSERYSYEYGPSGADANVIKPISNVHNYPNPFNPQTTIDFSIGTGNTGTLEIYNLKGQLIHSQDFTSGDHSYVWNATDQASGIYFYKVSSDEFEQSSKMVLLK